MIDDQVRVYEQGPLFGAASDTGATIRPGGLALTDHALAFCSLPAGARVLDVGCGAADSVEHLITHHGLNAVGLDPSALLLRAGRRRHAALPLILSSGEQLPIADAQSDVVLTECSLSVMKDTHRALAEFWRVLRPGGYLILSDVYARNPAGIDALRRLPIDSCLCGAVTQAESAGRVEAHGFTVRLWDDYTEALNAFAARLIWSHGSIQQLWCGTTSRADAADAQEAIARLRPGYYLLIGQKK
jgi:SAM-dependent methyltransferase